MLGSQGQACPRTSPEHLREGKRPAGFLGAELGRSGIPLSTARLQSRFASKEHRRLVATFPPEAVQ